MFVHFLSSAWTHYIRSPFTTLVNLLALALGLASFLAAWGVASYWGLTDAGFANADRTVLVKQQFVATDFQPRANPWTAPHAAKYIREDIPIVEAAAHLSYSHPFTVKAADRSINLRGAATEQDLFAIFDFTFLAGTPDTALEAADGLVLTEQAAEQLFGDEPAMGQPVSLNGEQELTVTGIIAPVEQPSMLAKPPGAPAGFDFLFQRAPLPDGQAEWWLGITGQTFALLPEGDVGAAKRALDEQLLTLARRRIPENQMNALKDIWFGSMTLEAVQVSLLNQQIFRDASPVFSVTGVLFGLGLIILLISCVNYANLATAQAIGSTKEVGLRKVVGASRSSIVVQYWLEALILTVMASLLAAAIILAVSPIARNITGIDVLGGLFSQPLLPYVAVLLVLIVSVAASFYPALFLSGVRPVEALRSGRVRGGGRWLTEALVGAQFAGASTLLIMVFIVGQQNRFMQSIVLQPDADPVVVLQDAGSVNASRDGLANALASETSVKGVSQINYIPWSGYENYLGFASEPVESAEESVATISYVGFDFFEIFEAEVLAGRAYDSARDAGQAVETAAADEDNPLQDLHLVIDRTMAESLGFATPDAAIGQTIFLHPRQTQIVNRVPTFRIIGVVETVPLVMGIGDVRSNVYLLDDRGGTPIVRIDRNQVREGLAAIERAVKTRAPDAAVSARFVDDEFERAFQTYQGINQGFQGLSLIAFLISAMGLFAMAMFTAARRRHEIGIRKTLGASTGEVMILMLKDFSRPVIIANLIAWPIAFFAARGYLSGFMQRTDLSPWPWILALVITLGIAWISVGGQAWRAARVNPAEVLKDE